MALRGRGSRNSSLPGTFRSPQWDRQPCLWGHLRDLGGDGPGAPSTPQHAGSGAGGLPFAVAPFPRRAARGSPARCHAEQERAFCLGSAGRGQRRCCALPRALEGVHTPGCGRPRALPRRDRSSPAPGPAPGPGDRGEGEREPGVSAAGAAERLPWLPSMVLHGNGPTSREQQLVWETRQHPAPRLSQPGGWQARLSRVTPASRTPRGERTNYRITPQQLIHLKGYTEQHIGPASTVKVRQSHTSHSRSPAGRAPGAKQSGARGGCRGGDDQHGSSLPPRVPPIPLG